MIKLTEKNKLKISKWSGGKTTELKIYPENSIYEKRNFLWRVSTATVETEKSNFTKLLKIKRILMILEGKIKLIHENHYEKILSQYEKDSFMGDWETKSFGKVTDFNLMLSKNFDGDIKKIIFKNKSISKKLEKKNTYIFYSKNGRFDFYIENKKYTLNSENTLEITDFDGKIIIEKYEQSTLIYAKVFKV
ncbi:hypothetical protein OSSY52_13520 [Tepiditoga spiralis]|uniref:HutD-family protein n=1 Tax=Tepiditoga spiralis TaxID=2108365 RepID=A0A7G1G4C6_9BACT|nr:HutD family protein [Tepiditoga spiralis]BBE31211.1 hypothetical protein OSSY52_13520 [Tepiditoga spiralis]